MSLILQWKLTIKLDIVKQAIKANENEISDLEKELIENNNKLETLNNEISELNLKILDTEQIINGNKLPINLDKFAKMTGEFFNGWLKFLVGANFSKVEIQEATKKTNDFVAVYINKYKSQTIINH